MSGLGPGGESAAATRIVLSNGSVFCRAEERVREYCEIEVYRDRNYAGGYDDRHNVTDAIEREDVESANNLYGGIKRIDFQRIMANPDIPAVLATLRDGDIAGIADDRWQKTKGTIQSLILAFVSIGEVDLPKAMKILHLKRPHLIPPLDALVVKFVTGNDIEVNRFSTDEVVRIGMDSLEAVRADLLANREAFEGLQARLADLPVPLTAVRLHAILCWTQEKWVNLRNPAARYGTATRSLDQAPVRAETTPSPGGEPEQQDHAGEITTVKEFRRVVAQAEGVIVITGTKPPRAHSPLCDLISDDRFVGNTSLGEGRGMKYYWRSSLLEARKEFGAAGCKRCKP